MTHNPSSPSDRWDAFEAIAREQYAALCAYAYRYVYDRDAAEEIVQDVLFRVWQRRGQIADEQLIAYVFRSTANAAISRLRAERGMLRRNERLREESALKVASIQDPAEELELKVREAIEALPEKCRLVFLLSRDTGLTYPQIAERLGISVKTVENHIVKALRLLRLALQAYLAIAFTVLK